MKIQRRPNSWGWADGSCQQLPSPFSTSPAGHRQSPPTRFCKEPHEDVNSQQLQVMGPTGPGTFPRGGCQPRRGAGGSSGCSGLSVPPCPSAARTAPPASSTARLGRSRGASASRCVPVGKGRRRGDRDKAPSRSTKVLRRHQEISHADARGSRFWG